MRINPDVIFSDGSAAAVAHNTAAMQAALDEQAQTYAPIFIDGQIYVGPLFPKSQLYLVGENRYYSRLLFDPRLDGVDRDAALFDLHEHAVQPYGSIIERIGFHSVMGQNADQRHVGFAFRRAGESNRNVKMTDVSADGFSDAFIELPNSWNCSFHDLIGNNCGRPAAQNAGKEGAFLRLGFQDEQPDSMVSSGNVYKNFYLNGCNHGITCQEDTPGGGLYNIIYFQRFEQIYAERCGVGIFCPVSRDCVLSHCYFEGNTEHGAVMGHARVESCRYRPDSTDDIVVDPLLYPWEPALAQHEFSFSERVLRIAADTVAELWAPRHGLVSISSEHADGLSGIVKVRTRDDDPECKPIAGFSPQIIFATEAPDLNKWPGKIAVLSPGDSRLWVQNRTNDEIEMSYGIMGPPWG